MFLGFFFFSGPLGGGGGGPWGAGQKTFFLGFPGFFFSGTGIFFFLGGGAIKNPPFGEGAKGVQGRALFFGNFIFFRARKLTGFPFFFLWGGGGGKNPPPTLFGFSQGAGLKSPVRGGKKGGTRFFPLKSVGVGGVGGGGHSGGKGGFVFVWDPG